MAEEMVAKSNKLVLNQRQRKMWPILMLGVFFEGFDDALINIALPYISADFGLNNQQVGFSLSIIGFGTMFAFFIVRLADRFGRRPMFLFSIVGYTICSFVSAFSPTMAFLVIFQFIARIFLIGCWSIGYVIIAEEFSAENRGKASSMFQVVAVFGALLLSLLLPILTALGLNWRAMYIIGALPLIPVIFWHKWLPETENFRVLQEQKKLGVVQEKVDFFALWKPPYVKYFIVMSLVWVFLYFGVKGTLNFFTMRMVTELSWTPGMISIAMLLQTLAGMLLIAVNGKLLDKWGRKKAAAFIIIMGSVTASAVFLATNFYVIVLFGCLASGFTNSFLMVGSTITNELFPTDIRASAMAWSNNIVGRIGQIAVPSIIGLLALVMGLGHAVSIAVLAPLISLVLIMVFIPETGGQNYDATKTQKTKGC